MQELEAERARREKTNKKDVAKQKEPRASTSDAEARVMKIADGGFRPAYNMQIIAEPEERSRSSRSSVDTSGSDRGLARPALEALAGRGYKPSGFIGGETDQWYPLIYDGVIKVEPPKMKDYHFSRGHDEPGDQLGEGPAVDDAGQAVLRLLTRPAQCMRRTMCRRSGPTSTRASSTRAGTRFARKRSSARRSSA